MSTITIALAGLGSRGKDAYAQALAGMPEQARIVAVADPDPDKVREVARQFEVPAERCFSSAEAMLAQPKLADALILCTQGPAARPPGRSRAVPGLRHSHGEAHFPRSGPVQGDFVRGPSNGAEGGRLPCAALRALLPENQGGAGLRRAGPPDEHPGH